MVFALILLSVVSLVVGEYEVGSKYNYFYDANTAFTSKPIDSPANVNSYNFSCIASIVCLSAKKDGFEFKLELTGIHLIQRDTNGKIISDASGLKVDGAFNKQFTFTILRTGGVSEVKHFEGDTEDILKVKIGIVSQFITLGDNETDDGPTETLDNQGMYLSHWKRGIKREKDDVVELTRHYTDEDFIHHRDRNVTEDSFLLNAIERKKMRSGVVTESALEHNIYIAGKEFHRRGRRIGDDTEKRKRMAAGHDVSNDLYNGTELSCASFASLQHINTVATGRHPRGSRRVSSSNTGAGKSDKENVTDESASQMKLIDFFNKSFYIERTKMEQVQKTAQDLSKNPSPSFASLVKRKKNNFCESKEEDEDGGENKDKSKGEGKDGGKGSESGGSSGDKKEDEEEDEDEEDEAPSLWELWEKVEAEMQQASDFIEDNFDDDDWVTDKKRNANRANVSNSGTKVRLLKPEDVFRITDVENPRKLGPSRVARDTDWEQQRQRRIHGLFSLGGIIDAIQHTPPKRLCPGFDPKIDEDYVDMNTGTFHPAPKVKPGRRLRSPAIQKLHSRLSRIPLSSPSDSLLSPSPFDSFASTSNGKFSVECPPDVGLTKCNEIGGGQGGGNDDFGAYNQAVIYTGSQRLMGLDCKAIGGCNFLLDLDIGIYIKVLGKNITIFHLMICSYRVDNYKSSAFISFVLFGFELGCHFQDTGCASITKTICEVEMPIPNMSFSFKQSFMIFDIEFKVGLFATFKLEFVFEVCPTEGSVSVSLPPSLGLWLGVEASISILKSKAKLEISAATELTLVPEIALNLSENAIRFGLYLKWKPIILKMGVSVKICILFFPCFGGSWNLIDWSAPTLIWTLFEKYIPLPWTTSNDAYGTMALEDAAGSGSEIKVGMGKKEDGRSAVNHIGEALDGLLTDTDAGSELVEGVNAKVKVAEGGNRASK